VQEYIPLGQRVKAFSIEAWINGDWKVIDEQTTIGNKRILRFDNVTTDKLRFNVLDAKACPTISNIEVYHAPKLLEPPLISRDKDGLVTITPLDSELEIYYTLDGNEPSENAMKYSDPFELKEKGVVRAIAADPSTGDKSASGIKEFDICKTKWTVISPNLKDDPKVAFVIDDNEQSSWRSERKNEMPKSIVIDLGENLILAGFTYLPTQARYIDGTVANYQFFVSQDGKSWGQPVSEGEFSNIENNPILQTKSFDPIEGRYIKLTGIREINDRNFISIGEIGVLTE